VTVRKLNYATIPNMEFEQRTPVNPRLTFLKKSHLFHGLDDSQLTLVSSQMTELQVAAGWKLTSRNLHDDSLFMVVTGRMEISQNTKRGNQVLSSLVPGDFIREDELHTSLGRVVQVTALEPTTLLVMSREALKQVSRQFHSLKLNLDMTSESHRLRRLIHFDWLQPEEVIYFMARKHPILLWQALAGPLILLIGAFLLFWFSNAGSSLFLKVLAWLGFFFSLAWGAWQWLDWTNDYYIVTNKRVIWLEKVIGIYDSRQEAPLTTILSVGVETDQLGRILDYGDVGIRTYVGRILFQHVNRPFQAAAMIEEHWSRSRERTDREDAEAMKQAIRKRLGLPVAETDGSASEPATAPMDVLPGVLQVMFSNLFKTRVETSTSVTYRKHWFVLVQQTWQPALFILLILGVLIFRFLFLAANHLLGGGSDTLILLLVLALIAAGLWWLYQFVNWRNDIYQVTEDQLLDILKTPLGSEQRKAAPLDNILSTEYKRLGLLQLLFNFGNVYITVGGSQLVFENVADPPAVQQDIDQRRVARMDGKKQAEKLAERDRLADWFAVYHQDSGDYPNPPDSLENP